MNDSTPRSYKPAELLWRKLLGTASGVDNSSFKFVADAGRWGARGDKDSAVRLTFRSNPGVPVSRTFGFQSSYGGFPVRSNGLPLLLGELGVWRWPVARDWVQRTS